MNWDDLRYLLALHRQGSHKGAARQLGVAPTTISRRIFALEEAAGARLFVRVRERLKPTPAGLVLSRHAERIEAEVATAERESISSAEGLAGPLRVTGGDALINHVVIPALPGLLNAHPEIAIELRTDTSIVDLSRREADVALRLVRPKEPALVARRIGELPFGIFASEAYLERHGKPRTLAAAGVAHQFIGYHEALDQLPQVRWLHREVRPCRYALRASTLTSQVIACGEGLGLALLPIFSANGDRRLRQLFPGHSVPTRELWIVFHADLRGDSRVSKFSGWLSEAFAPHIRSR
jgi:DNA-binding transcriptional LysR family regulator